MHNRDHQEWDEYGHPSDYGPVLFDGKDKIPHLGVPRPFRDDFGIIDGTYGALEKVSHKKSPITGKPYSWKTGGWRSQRELKYESDEDRDATGDELNAEWAIKRLKELAVSNKQKPLYNNNKNHNTIFQLTKEYIYIYIYIRIYLQHESIQ